MRRSSYGSRGCRTALQRIFLHPGRVIVLREVVANPGLLVGVRSVRQHVLGHTPDRRYSRCSPSRSRLSAVRSSHHAPSLGDFGDRTGRQQRRRSTCSAMKVFPSPPGSQTSGAPAPNEERCVIRPGNQTRWLRRVTPLLLVGIAHHDAENPVATLTRNPRQVCD